MSNTPPEPSSSAKMAEESGTPNPKTPSPSGPSKTSSLGGAASNGAKFGDGSLAKDQVLPDPKSQDGNVIRRVEDSNDSAQSSQSTESATDKGGKQEHAGRNTASNDNDLEPMDWNEFTKKYQEAMKKACKEEEDIIDEFESLADTFGMWAEAAAQYDNERACKRLRTRTRYVQLSEERLEEKKQQYIRVVNAFRQALALLT